MRLLPLLLGLALLPMPGRAATAEEASVQSFAAQLPDGRTLAFTCAGTGSPTLLLEAGWAADSQGFASLMAPLARLSRVCAYDRAGAGGSSPGPLPRTPEAIARDLVAGLAAAGLDDRLILVGHSAGALYARQAAALLPGRVAGLLLLDPSIDDQTDRLARLAGPGAGSVSPQIARSRRCRDAAAAGADLPADPALKACGKETGPVAAARWEARLSEIEWLFAPDPAGVAARRAATSTAPVVVLTAGRDRTGPALALWQGLHAELAAQSPAGRQQTVEASGHMVMRDAPEAVATAAAALLVEARQATSPSPPAPRPAPPSP